MKISLEVSITQKERKKKHNCNNGNTRNNTNKHEFCINSSNKSYEN